MSESQLDISQLALDKSVPARGARPRRWVSRYLVPLGVLLGLAALVFVAAYDQLFAGKPVTVVPVVVMQGESQVAGEKLFQAAGWIEPRPTSVSVASLAPGVMEELLVVEGQLVDKGEPIARLITIDAELAVQRARSSLSIREGDLQRAVAEQAAAETRFEQPVHLKAELAEAQSFLAKASTEYEKVPFLIKAAAANVEFTRNSLESKRVARAAISGVIYEQAVKDFAAAEAELAELKAREPNLAREVDALQNRVDALLDQLKLLVNERKELDESKAKVVSAIALRDEAVIGLQQAELTLERTTIRAPIDGRILRLVAFPGERMMGMNLHAGQSSSTVAEMYDPKRLQVRADVRLEDVPRVQIGGDVEVETASSGKVIQGRVLQLTSSANVQKNTLEVKLELLDPPSTVSPEMLVTATFLAAGSQTKNDAQAVSNRLFVPRELVLQHGDNSTVWVVGPQGAAILQQVTLGSANSDGLLEVASGLNATDKLVATGAAALRIGDRLRVVGEDNGMGVAGR